MYEYYNSAKNCLKNLNGIQNLMKLYYVKFGS